MSAVLAMKTNNSELDSVRYYLRQWVRWKHAWRPNIGYPKAVPYLDSIRPTVDGFTQLEDYEDRIHAELMRQVDQAITKDLKPDHMHAVMVVYMREQGPAVWRSNRKPMNEIRELCWQAELQLIPAMRRRDLLL